MGNTRVVGRSLRGMMYLLLVLTVGTSPARAQDDAPPELFVVPGSAGSGAHPAINGRPVLCKVLVKPRKGQILEAEWDFGDGSPGAKGTVRDAYGIAASHKYPDTEAGKGYVATLRVTDAASKKVSTARYPIKFVKPTPGHKAAVALDDALYALHVTMQRQEHPQFGSIGFWNPGHHPLGSTALAVLAFEVNGFNLRTPSPYLDTIRRGLHYILSQCRPLKIAKQPQGEVDSNGNGFGISVATPGHALYELPLACMALVGSQDRERVAKVGPEGVVGRRFEEIVVDMLDLIAFAQTDHQGSFRGGWHYRPNSPQADMSVTQWPVLALMSAEEVLGLKAPPWVKTELRDHFLKFDQQPNGRFDYQGPGSYDSHGSSRVELTAAGLITLNFTGVPSTDARVKKAVEYITANWDKRNFGDYYAMYAVMKAAKLMKPEIKKFGDHEWYPEYVEYLYDNQLPNGAWKPDGLWANGTLAIAWPALILSKNIFAFAPRLSGLWRAARRSGQGEYFVQVEDTGDRVTAKHFESSEEAWRATRIEPGVLKGEVRLSTNQASRWWPQTTRVAADAMSMQHDWLAKKLKIENGKTMWSDTDDSYQYRMIRAGLTTGVEPREFIGNHGMAFTLRILGEDLRYAGEEKKGPQVRDVSISSVGKDRKQQLSGLVVASVELSPDGSLLVRGRLVSDRGNIAGTHRVRLHGAAVPRSANLTIQVREPIATKVHPEVMYRCDGVPFAFHVFGRDLRYAGTAGSGPTADDVTIVAVANGEEKPSGLVVRRVRLGRGGTVMVGGFVDRKSGAVAGTHRIRLRRAGGNELALEVRVPEANGLAPAVVSGSHGEQVEFRILGKNLDHAGVLGSGPKATDVKLRTLAGGDSGLVVGDVEVLENGDVAVRGRLDRAIGGIAGKHVVFLEGAARGADLVLEVKLRLAQLRVVDGTKAAGRGAGDDAAARGPASVLLVVDCSGSMKDKIRSGGERRKKYRVARSVIKELVRDAPKGLRIGIRIFGHSDDNNSEIVFPIGPLTPQRVARLDEVLRELVKPRGRTPMIRALLDARHDFDQVNTPGPKYVVMIGDGLENCGGRIQDVERAYRGGEVGLVLHVIGFDVQGRSKEATRARASMHSLATAGGGRYFDARNAEELGQALRIAAAVAGYEIVNADGAVVARGRINGDAVKLEPGRYEVRLVGLNNRRTTVNAKPNETIRLVLDDSWNFR